ncbi:MAG: insulinase family protein [Candidatus Azobacteroides sp.]|nr:insulinase family protein [Candidatus Azobacteroides sp.]
MKKIYGLVILFVSVVALNAQELDRSIRPSSAPAKEINIKDAQIFTLDNGLKVFLVEDKTTPIVYYSLRLDVKPALQGEKAGAYDMFGDVFGKATTSRSKEQLNKEIDLIGALTNVHINGGYISFLKKYEDKALELFSDILLHPAFVQQEYDLSLEKYKSYLAALADDGGDVNQRVGAALTYGKNFPAGEVTTLKTLDNIRMSDLENYYQTYFAPNVARLVIVGDVSLSEAKANAKKYFGFWKKKKVAVAQYVIPQAPQTTQVAYIVRPGAVQSFIDLTYPVYFRVGVPDYEAARLMNLILGNSGSGRLFLNLRETHSYTYGVYSKLDTDELAGRFHLTAGSSGAAAVKASVTDSALYETRNEINRLINEPVSEKELKDIKSYVVGNFARSLEQSETVASFALDIDKYNLPKDYFKNYLKRIEAVTASDIQAAAGKYLKPGNAWIVVTGDQAYAENLASLAGDQTVHFYDFDANPTEAPSTQSVDIDAETLIDRYVQALGGKTALDQIDCYVKKGDVNLMGMPLQMEEYFKKPNLQASFLLRNGQVTQQKTFDGTTLKMSGMANQELTEGPEVEKRKNEAGICPELNYVANGYTLSVGGIEKLNGSDVYVLNSTKNGKTTVSYFDKESGLKVKSVSTEDIPMAGTQTISIEYSDYRTVEGVQFPFAIKQNAGGMVMDLNINSIDVNTEIPDSIFTGVR